MLLNVFIYLFIYSELLSENVEVSFDIQHTDLIKVEPNAFSVSTGNGTTQWIITVTGLSAGYSTVSANVTPANITS